MKYQIVLQWSLNNWEDFDSLVGLEKLIIECLSSDDFDVDGHDSGSGEMNIFIETNLPPSEAFSNIEGVSKESKHWCNVRAAFRAKNKTDYTILRPKELKQFRVG